MYYSSPECSYLVLQIDIARSVVDHQSEPSETAVHLEQSKLVIATLGSEHVISRS
jgi:hypothetical protein